MKKILKHKFNAKPQKIDEFYFDSKKEAEYFGKLKILQKANEILFFLRQVPLDLPGGIKYKVDFVEFHTDGSIHFVDIKGFMTPLAKNKIKQVENLYPIKIEIK